MFILYLNHINKSSLNSFHNFSLVNLKSYYLKILIEYLPYMTLCVRITKVNKPWLKEQAIYSLVWLSEI